MRLTPILAFSVLALGAACGATERRNTFDDTKTGPLGNGADGGFGDFGKAADNGLQVTPANAILFIDTATKPPTKATQAYKVIARTKDGEEDVAAKATFELEKPEIGRFNGATFESVGCRRGRRASPARSRSRPSRARPRRS